MANDEHLRKAFTFFDRNESGYIEMEELREALSDDDDANNEEVIIAIMHDVDTDKVRAALHVIVRVLFSDFIFEKYFNVCDDVVQDGRISYEEFATMMKAGTDWRKASRQYSRERFNSLSLKLMREGSVQLAKEGR